WSAQGKFIMSDNIAQLEQQLDGFGARQRREALVRLWDLAKLGQIPLAATGADVNLHSHTFFSYNAHGYSPSKFAWLARKRGLAAAGIVDFDVLDGLEEFWAVGKLLGLKRCASLESRVFVPGFSSRVINSPGEPGIAYHMGVGFPREVQHPLFSQMRRTAESRNRELVRRVNRFLDPVGLDYNKDVLPLTPNGNATERHICEAYSKKGDAVFWKSKIGDCPADTGKFQALIRSKLMKKGGPGYVRPGKDSFPLMSDMNRFIQEAGAIPTLTWLDGTSEGEQAIEELFAVAMSSGTAAINIIPDRNYTPGVKSQTLQNLYDVVALAGRHDFPVIVGTEMNAPGNKFVDDFNTAELKPLVPVFLKGAHIVYAHSVLQRESGLGYLSSWTRKSFASTAMKNDFFEKLGRELHPANEEKLRGLPSNVTPENIFAKIN
ncbi:MAG TPA: hypothetical protein VFY06_00140, partial [Verrucomicrobiae bacterium]|nr:hypothetical protein [Verrucomicrobiae bacterium]